MEENLEVQNSSVEVGESANSNNEGVDNPIIEDNPGSLENNEGLENNPEDNPGEGEVNTDGIETSKSFAKRLSEKTKAIEKQYEEKYNPYTKVIEREAKKYGLTADEYIAELDRQAEEERIAAEAEADKNKYGDLSKEQIDKLKKADEIIQNEAKQQNYNKEMQEFSKAFSDIKSLKDIPDEVFAIRELEGCSLTTAYKSYMFDKANGDKEAFKLEAEQKAIKGLINNQKTPGLQGKNKPDNSERSINDIPSDEFEKMIQLIKMGKKDQIKF